MPFRSTVLIRYAFDNLSPECPDRMGLLSVPSLAPDVIRVKVPGQSRTSSTSKFFF